jgi:Ca2+-binding RTX toxin-like protein
MALIKLGTSDPRGNGITGRLPLTFSFSGWTETLVAGGLKLTSPILSGSVAPKDTLVITVDANNNVTSVVYSTVVTTIAVTPPVPVFTITGLLIPLATFRANSANIMPLLTAGDDAITGSSFDNGIYGQGGNDTIFGGGGNDLIDGGDGNDIITGNSGFMGAGGNDQLFGGAGDDILSPGTASSTTVRETVDGGTGIDTVTFGGRPYFGLVVDLAAGTATAPIDIRNGNGGTVFAALTSIENVTGSHGDDKIYGDAGANVLDGGAGNDILDGRGGNDILVGGAGADQLIGGAGSDTASYIGSTAAVDVNLSINYAGLGDAEGDVLTGIENLRGSANNDALIGNNNANIIEGGAGADWLSGLGGTDTLSYVNSATTGVSINLDSGYAANGDAEGDIFQGFENVTGSKFSDWIFGDAGANVINGGAGNDVLMGGAGADTLIGGAGIDTAIYTWATSAVDVNLYLNAGSLGESTGDKLSGIENLTGSAYNDALIGNDGNNILDGAYGNDWLSAGGGADTIIGGAGNDTLLGGAGRDVFLFNTALSATTNVDFISDFNVAEDTVQLENDIFTQLTSIGTLAANLFKDLGLGAQDGDDSILYDRATGKIVYDSNGLVAGGQTLFADLKDGLVLTHANFVVV